MDMEIQFLHETFTGKGPLMNHIRRMGSGEAPLFSTTLSLVYDKLVEKTVARSVPSGSGLGKSIEIQDAVVHTTLPQMSTFTPQASAFTPPTSWSSFVASSSTRPPVPTPAPASWSIPSKDPLTWLVCHKCRKPALSANLYDGVRCPKCPSRGPKKGRPFMQCRSCGEVRAKRKTICARKKCKAKFR